MSSLTGKGLGRSRHPTRSLRLQVSQDSPSSPRPGAEHGEGPTDHPGRPRRPAPARGRGLPESGYVGPSSGTVHTPRIFCCVLSRPPECGTFFVGGALGVQAPAQVRGARRRRGAAPLWAACGSPTVAQLFGRGFLKNPTQVPSAHACSRGRAEQL